jgi:DNA-directed RNA polymerase specialized sigma54-like protein
MSLLGKKFFAFTSSLAARVSVTASTTSAATTTTTTTVPPKVSEAKSFFFFFRSRPTDRLTDA